MFTPLYALEGQDIFVTMSMCSWSLQREMELSVREARGARLGTCQLEYTAAAILCVGHHEKDELVKTKFYDT